MKALNKMPEFEYALLSFSDSNLSNKINELTILILIGVGSRLRILRKCRITIPLLQQFFSQVSVSIFWSEER